MIRTILNTTLALIVCSTATPPSVWATQSVVSSADMQHGEDPVSLQFQIASEAVNSAIDSRQQLDYFLNIVRASARQAGVKLDGSDNINDVIRGYIESCKYWLNVYNGDLLKISSAIDALEALDPNEPDRNIVINSVKRMLTAQTELGESVVSETEQLLNLREHEFKSFS